MKGLRAAARLSDRLTAASRGWTALAALVVFLLFTSLALPAQAAQQRGDVTTPDMSWFYTAADLYGIAERLGADGRQAYIQARFTFDLVWPAVYGSFLTISSSWLLAQALRRRQSSRWRLLNLTPVMGVGFDLLENIATSLVMARYPAPTPVIADLAGWATMVKWVFVGGSFIVLVGAATAALLSRRSAEG